MAYTLMTFEEYMSEGLKYERLTLGEGENKFLYEIMGEPKSAYTIYSILKEQGRGIAYKNVYKRIKRLEELKLINKDPRKFAHRAINYGLTTQGLFYLLSRFVSYKAGIYWDNLWKYYADNIILKTLVLPYFEIETLRDARFNLSASVLAYLRNCYLITLDGCEYIKQLQLPRNDHTVKPIINSLKRELEWEAKEMAFSLVTKSGSDFGIWLAISRKIEIERAGKAGVEPAELGKDRRFMKLLYEVQKEFDQGFKAADAVAQQGK